MVEIGDGDINIKVTGKRLDRVFPNGREAKVYPIGVERGGQPGVTPAGYLQKCTDRWDRHEGWIVVDEDGEVVIGIADSARLGSTREDAMWLLARKMNRA